MEVVVVSGKGGAGKTVVAAGLAVLLSSRLGAVVDADAETPNLAVLLGATAARSVREVGSSSTAVVDGDCCTGCGCCSGVCVYGCITLEDGRARVSGLWCEGCGACVYSCPSGCIRLVGAGRLGWVRVYDTRYGVPLVEASVPPGRPNSGRLVSEARIEARRIARGSPVLVDAAAGTGCQVVASVAGARLAVLVVEDTRAGLADASRAARLLRHFHVPCILVVSKYRGVRRPEAYAEELGLDAGRLAGVIPYSSCVVEAYREGRNPLEECAGFREALEPVAERLAEQLGV